MSLNTLSDREAISHCVQCIDAVQKLVSPSFTLTHMRLVFHIFLNQGTTRADLEDMTGLARSTVNRYVQDLTAHSWIRPESGVRPAGHDLIMEVQDERNMKIKHIYLNDRGRDMIKAVVDQLITLYC